jgi:hypothetical protein
MVDKKRQFLQQEPEMHASGELVIPNWEFAAAQPVSLADLYNGAVPARKDVSEKKSIYHALGKAKLYPFAATQNGKDIEYITVAPPLNAEEVNSVLYFAAPAKSFGLDTDDIISDWHALYDDNSYAAIKKPHTHMQGWAQWEASRLLVLGVIERNFEPYPVNKFKQKNPEDVVIPVIRWRKDAEGNNRIVIDSLDDQMRIALATALPDHISDPSRLDNGMGIAFVSAYSERQTKWPKVATYGSSGKTEQTMGPTQVLAYAIRQIAEIRHGKKADDSRINPEHSPFLELLAQHIGAPEIGITDADRPNDSEDSRSGTIFVRE